MIRGNSLTFITTTNLQILSTTKTKKKTLKVIEKIMEILKASMEKKLTYRGGGTL